MVMLQDHGVQNDRLSENPEILRDIHRENANSILDKFLVGYQGWFFCGGDGPPIEPDHHGWLHWVDKPLKDGGRVTFDLWPSIRELHSSELHTLEGLTIPSRTSASSSEPAESSPRPAQVFSSRNPITVRRHFKWMREYGISGCFLQRFLGQVNAGDTGLRRLRDEVGDRVRESAEAEGRIWAVMYDVSGIKGADVEKGIKADWEHLINEKGILDSPMYLKDQGKPVIGIWGMGFAHDQHDPVSLLRLIEWIRNVTPGGAYIFAGVPSHWRDGEGDADHNKKFFEVWQTVDCISPWFVGRFSNSDEADEWRRSIREDMDVIRAGDESLNLMPGEIHTGGRGHNRGRDFAPVVFPGFSWTNLHGGPQNEIPRQGGQFLWRQLFNARAEGARIVYGAMFDEYDESTALMPSEPLHQNTPTELPFLSLDADGEVLPDDWYLRICGLAAKSLREGQPLMETFPKKELEEFFKHQDDIVRPSATGTSMGPPPIPPRPTAAFPADDYLVSPGSAPPVLPPRPHAGPARRVPPIPEGGMLHALPPCPPSRLAGLPEQEIPEGSSTSSSRQQLDHARHEATALFHKVATPDRQREAGQAWDRLTAEAGKLATPERQQKVMLGVAKMGSKGAQLLEEARKKAAEREL